MSKKPTLGQIAVTVGALVCTSIGLNTAYAFTASHLHITDQFTRVALCGTGEIVLIALGLAARENVRNESKRAAGLPGTLVWLITAFLAVPAFAEASTEAGGAGAGFVAGAWRSVFGPISAAVLWHFAMGLEIRQGSVTARSNSVGARILHRAQQTVLSWFGINEHDATAEEIARERARVRAANLTDTLATMSPRRQGGRRGARLRRQLRATLRVAGVAHDDNQRALLLADLAVSAHAADLASLDHASPWLDSPSVVRDSIATTPDPSALQVNDHSAPAIVATVAPDVS